MRYTISLLAILALTAAGWAGQRAASSSSAAANPPVADKSEPEKTTGKTPSTGAPVDPKVYIIGPEDVISVRVWREPENSGQFVVRPDGRVSLPLLGEVQAAGLTPEQLSNNIATGLQKVMVHPEVTIGVEKVNSKKYYIQGEVNRPGSFALVVPTTILEALGNAGGFRDFANTKKITVLRGTQTFKFNYHEVSKGKKMEQNIYLQPGDQIFVP